MKSLTEGEKSILSNLRRRPELANYTDQQLLVAFKWYSESEDFGDESKIVEWIGIVEVVDQEKEKWEE